MTAQRISPELRDIHAPAPLRDKPLWHVWRFEADPDAPNGKPLKVPYYTFGGRRYGRQGTPEDRAKLTTFAVAKAEAVKRGMSGVGFAALEGSGVTALDFDNCVVDGKVDPDVLAAIGDTYAEYSPSGRGVRAIVRGDLGSRKSGSKGQPFGFETFSTSGFVTITGNMLPHIDILGLEDTVGPVTAELRQLCERRFGSVEPKVADPDDFMAGHEPKLGLTEERMLELLGKIDPDIDRDGWIRVGMALHHETDGSEDGFQLWNDWSSDGYKYPSEEALRGQWESFERRRGAVGKQVTMASVVKMAKDAAPATVDDIVARADAIVGDTAPGAVAGTPSDWDGKFAAIPFGQIAKGKPTDWLVKGVLPAAEMVAIYGPSGAGKSFVALDLAAAISRGVSWRGRKTKQTRVVIIAAEGAGGYAMRAQALAQQWCVEPSDFDIALITAKPNVMEDDDIAELVATVKAVGQVGLVIIDTLAQVTPGANENTSEDMGLALAHCHTLSKATGATIALVHHSGKDLSRGARGWSGFKAAMDAEIEVSRDPETDAREVIVRKQKDGRDGEKFPFKLETVVLGLDDDGDEVTSCVVVPVVEVQKREAVGGKRRGNIETHLLEVMTLFSEDDVVSVDQFIRKAVETMPAPDEGKRDVRRQNITRALHSMSREKDGPLKVDGGIVVFYE